MAITNKIFVLDFLYLSGNIMEYNQPPLIRPPLISHYALDTPHWAAYEETYFRLWEAPGEAQEKAFLKQPSAGRHWHGGMEKAVQSTNQV